MDTLIVGPKVTMSSMAKMPVAEKILQIDLFLIGISVCLLVVVILSMFFISDSKTYRQMLSSLKFLCFVLIISLVFLIIGYLFVDTFAEYVRVYLVNIGI